MTRTTALTAAAFGILTFSALPSVIAQDAQTILTKVSSVYTGMKTYQADMAMIVASPQGKMNISTTIKKSGEKMAMKINGSGGGAPAGAMNINMVSDGKNVFIYMGMMNQYMKRPLDAATKAQMNKQGASPEDIIKMAKKGTLKKLADSTVNGKPAFVLETKQGSGTSKIYVAKSNYHLLRVDGVSAGAAGMGAGNVTMTISNEKINPVLPASTFVFTPPKGAKMMQNPMMGGGAPR